MAKYDKYVVRVTEGTKNYPIVKELDVLFEDGDLIAPTIIEANDIMGASPDNLQASLDESLLQLEEAQFLDLLENVWVEQMRTMGNGRYDYANRLRDAVNRAQNA